MDALENSSDVPKLAAPVPKSTPVSSSHAAGGALAPARAPGPAKASAAPDLTTIDLQRVPPSVVVQAKAAMDVAFEANRKRPGEEGYVYDIQVEFGEGSESNEWDEEED
jgi:CEP19-like protein